MSEAVVPVSLLVRLEIPIRRRPAGLRLDGRLRGWSEAYRLPTAGVLDGVEPFGEVYLAWDEEGLYVACRVGGKTRPPRGRPEHFWQADHLRLMTDMRAGIENRRATRYCQQFYFLPVGGGSDGRRACAGTAPIHRAVEAAPPVPPERIRVASQVSSRGWSLEAHIPGDCLAGFDPAEHRRIGVCTVLEDSELGQQFLTVDDELQWYIDPSTWAMGVLVD